MNTVNTARTQEFLISTNLIVSILTYIFILFVPLGIWKAVEMILGMGK